MNKYPNQHIDKERFQEQYDCHIVFRRLYWEQLVRGCLSFLIIVIIGIAVYYFLIAPESPTPSTTQTETKQVVSSLPQSGEVTPLHFTWEYDNRKYDWELGIPIGLYNYYQELPRPPTRNYSVYITHPLDDNVLTILASKLENVASERSFSSYKTVEFVSNFIQSLPYTVDNVTTPYDEYPRYPIETLVDYGGDCEDTSILLASILYAMRYETVLIQFPHHMGVGVLGGEGTTGSYYNYNGEKYFYIETTGIGWGIGVLPEQYHGTKARVYEMVSVPILIHEWEANRTSVSAEMKVTVKNLGTATAENVFIHAGFDAGDNKVWNTQQSEVFTLPANKQITVTINLRVPQDKHTRYIVQIIYDGHAVDESYSKWIDT